MAACAGNAERRDDKMRRLRSEYADAVANYFSRYDAGSASAPDQATYNQIYVDLPRTNPGMALFQVPSTRQEQLVVCQVRLTASLFQVPRVQQSLHR